MLAAVALIAAVVAGAAPQQAEPVTSAETIRASLLKSPPPLRLVIPAEPPWVTPVPRRVGIITLEPATGRGEIIKASLPVGDLATRAAHALAESRRNRATQKAHDEVARTLQAFQAEINPQSVRRNPQ